MQIRRPIQAIIAADLLAQSEHDKLAKGILVTTDRQLGLDVIEAVRAELGTLETADIACSSWESYGEVIFAENLKEAVSLANEYAPEHLEVILDNADEVTEQLCNYGSLFIGQETGEVFGDYASGTNHTLPTIRASRYTGGVWTHLPESMHLPALRPPCNEADCTSYRGWQRGRTHRTCQSR
ncbi:MAG: histidinol dehydrogenase [Eisenbergiella sp.]